MAQLPTPKFNIGGEIYIVASAAGRGFLESYIIDGISYDPRAQAWIYKINVARPPSAGVTVGDRNQLVRERVLYFSEAELTDFCSALHMNRAYLQRALASVEAKIAACGTEGSA